MRKVNYSPEIIHSKIERICEDFDYSKNKNMTLFDCKNRDIEEMLREVPSYSGLIVLFEEIDGRQRIVFVGNSKNVKKRVQEYVYDKERNATLKRHIGYAMINAEISKDKLPKEYAKLWWEYENSAREKNPQYMEVEDEYCKKVLLYIREKISFVVVPVKDSRKRISLAWRLLSTLSRDSFKSGTWLGKNSLHPEVQNSGLWAMRTYLSKVVMEDEDFSYLEKCLRGEE